MSQMNTRILIPALIALMGVSAGAWADKPDDGEVTIRLMPAAEVELPAAVTNPIELPSHLRVEDAKQAEKLGRAKQALEDATANRNKGRDHGLSHADEAREQAQDMADNANAKNENRGRSEDRPDPPDPPGRPDNPGRP